MGKPAPTTHKQKDSPQAVGTPELIVRPVFDFWHPGIDLAASEDNALCTNFITEEQNSLVQPWHKLTGVESPGWCNHPYNCCKDWVEKSYEEAHLGATVITLQPCALHRKYAKKFMKCGPCSIVLIGNAVKFVGYPHASSVIHKLVFWNKNLIGKVYWCNLKDREETLRIFTAIKEQMLGIDV